VFFSNLSKRKVIRKVDGLPTTTGSFWVEQDTEDTIHPAPTKINFKTNESGYVILQKERTTVHQKLYRNVVHKRAQYLT
jgi:hypothetical protein